MDSKDCKEHSGLEARVSEVEKQTGQQWDAINKLRNRPPIWVTFVIAALTGLLGWSLSSNNPVRQIHNNSTVPVSTITD